MNTILIIWLALLGVAIGSFLNVVIHRLPKDESLFRPRSRCPRCGNCIAWYDNIPLLSYAVLRGRCRSCGRAISPRYPIVEAVTAILTVTLWVFCRRHGEPIAVFVVYEALVCALVAATFIDYDLFIIPNEITLPGIALSPVVSAAIPSLQEFIPLRHAYHLTPWLPVNAFITSLIGVVVSGGLVYMAGEMGRLILRKECMGFGDVKLMAMVGGILGWQIGVAVFFIAPFFGLTHGLYSLIFRRQHVIPYGPYLSMATIAGVFLQFQLRTFVDVFTWIFRTIFCMAHVPS